MRLFNRSRAARLVFATVLFGALAFSCVCNERTLPHPLTQCGKDGAGCLSDEVCVDARCEKAPACESDDDCKTVAFECVLPAQVCQLRAGFGDECSPDSPCGPGLFCALGLCHDVATARQCASRADCPAGQGCDHDTNFCIPECPCGIADEFPECGCDATEECDALTSSCRLECQHQCTPETVADDCSPGQQCSGACLCVQCLVDDDCGPGLLCNQRAGRCESENLCFSDADCESPLICDPATALCQAAPPACETEFDCQFAEVCNVGTGRCELPNGPCDDERFEDADTPANAEPIDVAEGQIVTEDALQLCPDDDDVYAITLSAGDVLIASVTDTDPLARATVWLLDSLGETSEAFAEAPPRGTGRIVYSAQVDETVYLRVNALVGASPYVLVVERQGGTPCQPDFFEGGTNNDSLVAATDPSLTPDNADLAAVICPEDEDFYRVNVATGEAVSATLTFDDSATDLDLAFIDSAGNLVTQSSGTSQPETVRRRFFDDPTMYLRVRGFGNDTGAYTLRIDHEPPFVCTDDVAEPDDNVATATLVPLNQALTTQNRTMCAGDVDMLTLPLEDFERAIIQAKYDDTEMEARVEVLNDLGDTVLATSPTATGGAALSYDAQGNQTVLVRISSIGGTVGAYTLSIAKENQLSCTPDDGEPNDTVATASPAALPFASDLLTLCEPDADFYSIQGEAGKKLIATASFRQAEADIDLMLIGLDGAQVLGVADGTSDGETLEVILPVTGTYTLRVFSLTSDAKARYTLDVDQVSP